MKVKTSYVLIGVIVILVILASPMFFAGIKTKTDTNKIALPSIDDVPVQYWTKLAEKKIFFGHKSVGYNIIDGVKDIMKERSHIKLNIVETHDPLEFDRPIFAHAQVGRNTYPASKIKAFENIMDSGVGDKVDIAFFKFCYIDVIRDSNPQQIFTNYRNTIEDLRARYPQTKFLHVTVPVCSTPKGAKRNFKESIKLLIGSPGVLDDNLKRQHYNTLLNDAFSKTGPLFDVALIESISPSGSRCYAVKDKAKIYFMDSQYTSDGGHLNEKGRKRVAEQLLIVLAELANKL
jgi:lysophospholipase L1-like esterase